MRSPNDEGRRVFLQFGGEIGEQCADADAGMGFLTDGGDLDVVEEIHAEKNGVVAT